MAPGPAKDSCAPILPHMQHTQGHHVCWDNGHSRVDKGLVGLALALSQILEALPSSEEGQKVSRMSAARFPTTW